MPTGTVSFQRLFSPNNIFGPEVTKMWPNTYLSSPQSYHIPIDQQLTEIQIYFMHCIVHQISNLNIKTGTGISLHSFICLLFLQKTEHILGERCCPSTGTTECTRQNDASPGKPTVCPHIPSWAFRTPTEKSILKLYPLRETEGQGYYLIFSNLNS